MFRALYGQITRTISIFENVHSIKKMWREPLVKFVSLKNMKLAWLKEAVSPDHYLPEDILAGAKSLVCFFIPFHSDIVNSNAEAGPASREWALAYIKTNDLIKTINDDFEKLFAARGYKAGKIPATHNFDKQKLISFWSHRHLAFLAGLGSFGINNMLITEKGCCGRIGTMVSDCECDTMPPLISKKEFCLNRRNGGCGICRKKCEAGAYGDVFDRRACYAQCLKNAERHKDIGLADVCGKCLTGLPCSLAAPL